MLSAVAAAVATPSAPGTPVTDWKVSDVTAWLVKVELPQHCETFKSHSVDGALLLTLTEQDMYSVLGVVSPLHRKKLMMAIADLRKSYVM